VVVPQGVYLPGGRATQGLNLDFYPSFTLRSEDEIVSAPVALLTCLLPALEYPFAVLVEGLIQTMTGAVPAPVMPHEVLEYVEEWQELLRQRRELSKEEQLGLFGELLFICNSQDPDIAVEAWKGSEGKHFDFSRNGVDIDIKASLVEYEHYFSISQLQDSPSGSERYIQSLCLLDDPSGGSSLAELVIRARSVITCRIDFERKLHLTGFCDGNDYTDRFAIRSSRLFKAESVPRVRQIDPGVSEIRFKATLRSCPELGEGDMKKVFGQLLRPRSS
jgi:hypothetical protein